MKKLLSAALSAALIISSFSAAPLPSDAAGISAITENTLAAGESVTLTKSIGNPLNGFSENETSANITVPSEITYGGDPSVLIDPDTNTAYLYVGHDTSLQKNYSMPNWYCYSSKDMENWTCEGMVMTSQKDEITWTSSGNEAWAGQVMKYNGMYYFYYCTSMGAKCIGVSVGNCPTGWTDTESKAAYCSEHGINNNKPDSLHFVDIGHPLVIADQTWPLAHSHDDIDPTAWIETDENGVEHRYLGWGNSFFFICELNEDMITIKDQNEDGLITMKTNKSLLTTDDSTSVKYSDSKARSTVIYRDFTYPSNVTYTDFADDGSYETVSKTIPAGSEYPDGDIVCAKFITENHTGDTADTVYTDTTHSASAVDNDGKSLAGLIQYEEDGAYINGLFTYEDNDELRYHFYTEAPYLYRRQDENGNYYGKYYLFFAVDWREQMAYATCDDLMKGDWEFQGVIMPWSSTADTNHMAVFDFNGKTYFVYHNGSLPYGCGYRRSACVEELNFNEDGTIMPITETSTGLTGTTSWISDSTGAKITHAKRTPVRTDTSYPYVDSKALAVNMATDVENEGDSKWELVVGRYEHTNENYVSIESWNCPGLYLTASGTDVVLSQESTADYKVSSDTTLAKQMTFETVTGLNGSGISFKNVNTGTYLTSSNGDLVMSDGSDADACSFNVESRAALSSITAAKTKTTYAPGSVLDLSDLTITAIRKDGTSDVIDPADCTINASSINMNKEGKQTLTITYREDNFIRTTSVPITVAKPFIKVTKISVSPTSSTLTEGKTLTLKTTLTPSNATNKSLKYSSSKPSIATVSSKGVISAKKAGSTTITVAAKDGSNVKSTVKITVKAKTVKAKKVTLNKKKISLKKGKTFTLKASLTPKNSTDKIKWSTSKKSVATVSSKGKVTAKKKGSATITAKSSSGKKATCKVTVK